MDDREIAAALRGLVARGLVRTTSDAGAAQTAEVTVARHVDRSGVEIIQPFGLASRPPAGGSMVVLAVGGDQGDLVGLPVAAPSSRLGHLAEGESALYGGDGTRVHIKADGTVHVPAGKAVVITCGDLTIEIDKASGRARMAHSAGMRVAVSATIAKLTGGGHFVAVSSGGVIVSAAPVVGADPDPAL